jgi:hypothetical protein
MTIASDSVPMGVLDGLHPDGRVWLDGRDVLISGDRWLVEWVRAALAPIEIKDDGCGQDRLRGTGRPALSPPRRHAPNTPL